MFFFPNKVIVFPLSVTHSMKDLGVEEANWKLSLCKYGGKISQDYPFLLSIPFTDDRMITDLSKAEKGLEILVLLGFSLLSVILKLEVKKDLFVLFKLSVGLAIFSGKY